MTRPAVTLDEQGIVIECADQLGVLLSKPKRVKIIVGGRASTKSTFVADVVLSRVANQETWCCAREFQNSIEDSVHSLLVDEIDRCEFNGFKINDTKINHAHGGKIFYRGLARNIHSLKSINNLQGLWIEEGETLSAKTLKILTASVRVSAKGAKDAEEGGKKLAIPEIWITMNRGSSKDPIAQQYLKRAESELARCGFYEDDLVMIVQINYDEIPLDWFLSSGLEQERLDDKKRMSQAEYDHKWHGHYSDTVDRAIIKPEWFDACVDAHLIPRLEAVFKPHGMIVASHDPSDTGEDAKGFAIRHGSIITMVAANEEGEIDDGCDWATDLSIKHNADLFVWDCDGMGVGLKRQVATAFAGKSIRKHQFRGSLSGSAQDNADKIYQPQYGDSKKESKTYSETFYNNRAQYYTELANRCYNTFRCVMKGEYVNPDEMISFDSDGIDSIRLLRAEMCRIPTKPNNNGLIQIMSKKEMAALDIDSPNRADAIMMTLVKPKQAPEALPPLNYPPSGVV